MEPPLRVTPGAEAAGDPLAHTPSDLCATTSIVDSSSSATLADDSTHALNDESSTLADRATTSSSANSEPKSDAKGQNAHHNHSASIDSNHHLDANGDHDSNGHLDSNGHRDSNGHPAAKVTSNHTSSHISKTHEPKLRFATLNLPPQYDHLPLLTRMWLSGHEGEVTWQNFLLLLDFACIVGPRVWAWLATQPRALFLISVHMVWQIIRGLENTLE